VAALLTACTKTAGPSSSTALPTTTAPPALQMAVAGVVDPAAVGDAAVLPDPGTHYVRVSVAVHNPASVAQSFTPGGAARLVDDGGGANPPVPNLYRGDLAGADVPAGGDVNGTISFAVPDGRKPTRLTVGPLDAPVTR
jgi:hypothetical protein